MQAFPICAYHPRPNRVNLSAARLKIALETIGEQEFAAYPSRPPDGSDPREADVPGGDWMRRILLYSLSALFLLLIVASPSKAGPCSPDQEVPTVYVPDRGCVDIGFGYQYQGFHDFGRTFHDNGYNVDFGIHLFDWLTGATGRLTVGAEGTSVFGFGHTGGTPNLDSKSLFIGGGLHAAIQSHSRLEPWIHIIPGWQRYRFTQTNVLGANSVFGFMAGGGLDIRVQKGLYWRLEGDYFGTVHNSNSYSNYSAGTSLLFYF